MNQSGKLFLQDEDPSQNSALAREAMEAVGCRLFKIPARSPDLKCFQKYPKCNKEYGCLFLLLWTGT